MAMTALPVKTRYYALWYIYEMHAGFNSSTIVYTTWTLKSEFIIPYMYYQEPVTYLGAFCNNNVDSKWRFRCTPAACMHATGTVYTLLFGFQWSFLLYNSTLCTN